MGQLVIWLKHDSETVAKGEQGKERLEIQQRGCRGPDHTTQDLVSRCEDLRMAEDINDAGS